MNTLGAALWMTVDGNVVIVVTKSPEKDARKRTWILIIRTWIWNSVLWIVKRAGWNLPATWHFPGKRIPCLHIQFVDEFIIIASKNTDFQSFLRRMWRLLWQTCSDFWSWKAFWKVRSFLEKFLRNPKVTYPAVPPKRNFAEGQYSDAPTKILAHLRPAQNSIYTELGLNVNLFPFWHPCTHQKNDQKSLIKSSTV